MAVTLLFALFPAATGAAVLSSSGGVISYDAEPGDDNNLEVTLSPDHSQYVFQDSALLSSVGPECDGGQCPVDGVRAIQIWLDDRDDTLTIDNAVALPGPKGVLTSITALGGDGQDRLTGGPGPEELTGGPGNDPISGGGGGDSLDFPLVDLRENVPPVPTPGDQVAGTDTLDGGPGDDRLNGGPAGATEPDTLIGGDGIDTAEYSQRGVPLTISLDDLPDDGEAGEGDNVKSTVENVVGGSESDALIGSAAPNALNGADGDDRLVGLGGDDVLDGGTNTSGSDTLDGGDGADCLFGRAGDDRLVGGPGPDCLFGAGGSDALEGDGGDDTLAGGAGPDALEGDDGNDSLDGSEANLVGADGPDTLNGGPGADSLSGAEGDDRLDGDTGPDGIRGGSGKDTVTYENRDKDVTVTLNGRPDDGEAGERDNVASDVEAVIGGTLDDTLTGDRDPNALTGGSGQDLITGGAGIDRLAGGDAPDVVQARDGTRDIIDCGDDGDLAIVDPRDTVRNCATVDRGRRRRAVFGRSAVVRPARGGFGLALPDGSRLFDLAGTVKVPMGSTIDPGDGVRLVTAANAAGDRLEISVARGPFSLRQDPARPAVTELRLRVAAPTCGGSRAHAQVSGRDASGELLVTVDHKGRRNKPPPPGGQRKRVSVRGKHSDGAADGTSWLTVERCDGTLTRVDNGVVRVRDFGRHKTVLVRAGHRYLARAR